MTASPPSVGAASAADDPNGWPSDDDDGNGEDDRPSGDEEGEPDEKPETEGPDDGSTSGDASEETGRDEETGREETTGDETGEADEQPSGGLVVHLNTDGAFLTAASKDDAPAWESSLLTADADIPAYTNTSKAAAVRTALEARFDGLDIEVTTEDPGLDASYVMIVLTDESPSSLGLPAPVVGAANTDCGNDNPHNVSFVFDEESSDQTAEQLANSAAFNLGVGLGLNPTTPAGDAMNSTAQAQPTRFIDGCSATQDVACNEVPGDTCPAGTQNSYRAAVAALE